MNIGNIENQMCTLTGPPWKTKDILKFVFQKQIDHRPPSILLLSDLPLKLNVIYDRY